MILDSKNMGMSSFIQIGIGRVLAIRNLLKAMNKTLDDMELVEYLELRFWCIKELNLDMDKLNVNGGTITIGHLNAATSNRIIAHLVHELRRRKKKWKIRYWFHSMAAKVLL